MSTYLVMHEDLIPSPRERSGRYTEIEAQSAGEAALTYAGEMGRWLVDVPLRIIDVADTSIVEIQLGRAAWPL